MSRHPTASDAPPARTYPAKPADVYLFGTCVVDLFDPDAGVSTAQLLEREGIRVHFPQAQSCCGQPAYTSGFPDEARRVAAAQFDCFPEPWPIVVPSGSCAGMIHHHWPRLFADDPARAPRANEIAARCYELTEFLTQVCHADLRRYAVAPPAGAVRAVLHTSCSGRREMGTHHTSEALLGQLPHVTRVEQSHAAECCGFGGTFSVRHPEISAAMAGDKVDALLATGADVLVSADCGCLTNLNGTLAKRGERLRGQHIASFLWRQTGGDGA